MRSLSFCVAVFLIPCLSYGQVITLSNQEVRIPFVLENGYGSFKNPHNVGFRFLNLTPRKNDDAWSKTYSSLTGLPSNWENLNHNEIYFDYPQFVFQNVKQGNLPESQFEYVIGNKIELCSGVYSAKPIKCYVNIIYGKNPDRKLVCKIDTNNNLDFSDEDEIVVPDLGKDKFDSLLLKHNRLVNYETIKDGVISKKVAPILVVKREGQLLGNIAIHGAATFKGYKIEIRSSLFVTVDFTQLAISVTKMPTGKTQFYQQNEFVIVDGVTYHIRGVETKNQQLILREVPKDSVILNGQVGFYAFPFQLPDFETRNQLTLDQYKGKYLFIDFWGSWCSPCRAELPRLKSVYREIDKDRIDFLGIAVESAESLAEYLKKDPSPWTQIQVDQNSAVVKGYNIEAYPTNILINPQGKVIRKNLSSVSLLDSLRAIINKRL